MYQHPCICVHILDMWATAELLLTEYQELLCALTATFYTHQLFIPPCPARPSPMPLGPPPPLYSAGRSLCPDPGGAGWQQQCCRQRHRCCRCQRQHHRHCQRPGICHRCWGCQCHGCFSGCGTGLHTGGQAWCALWRCLAAVHLDADKVVCYEPPKGLEHKHIRMI